jgi:4-amino-4-deoxy-L-arabinose transferase-like glycosyltransferase
METHVRLLPSSDPIELTMVVPTYREAHGIASFLRELLAALQELGRRFEVIVVDDSSPDGTADIAERALASAPGRVVRRTGPRSLARSVMEGFDLGRGAVLGVMDADGSHPPAVVGSLLAQVDAGADVAWASRTLPEGGAPGLSRLRAAVSRLACSLVSGLTAVSDPTSGFFLVRRAALEGVELDPVGWKIGLEVLCRGRIGRVVEVPFRFEERRAGRSKFGSRAVLDYLRHLLRLRRDLPRAPDAPRPVGPLPSDLIVVLLVCAAAFLPWLGALPLTDPDEGLHALLARDVLERGDLLVPRVQGAPFLDKPPLFFVAVAASFGLLGQTELAARLPGALFSIGTAVVTLLVGRKLYGGRAGLIGAIVLATSALPLALARAVAPDTALTFFTTAALGAFAVAFRAAPARRSLLAVGWIATVLAFLTKGPPGLAVPAAAMAAALFATGTLGRWREARVGLGAVAIGLVAAPLALAVEARSPGFLRYFFYERVVLGFFTDTQRHGERSLLYYLPVVLVGSFPWVAFVVPALSVAGAGLLERRWADCVTLGSFLAVVTMFSLAGSKLPTYVLPAFPALALLLGAWLDRADEATLRRWALLLPSVLLVALAAAVVAGQGRWRLCCEQLAPLLGVGAATIVGSLVLAARAPRFLWRWAALTVVLSLWTMLLSVGPAVAEQQSSRRLAIEVLRSVPADVPVVSHRDPPPACEFYSRREVRRVPHPELVERLRRGDRLFVVVREKRLSEVEAALTSARATLVADTGTHLLFSAGGP